jgi:hypothetical protein
MKAIFNILFITFLVLPDPIYSNQISFVKNSDTLNINNNDNDFCDHFFIADTHYFSKQLNSFSDLMNDNTGVCV